jgi:2-dehydro-3-deoxyglucarate aldolase/4-hydroxy-2-oxoheptanedioate aldolase
VNDTAGWYGPLDGGRLRARVLAGEPTLGTFVGTASAVTAEVCAAVGFDWLLLDLEHGSGGEEQVRATVPVAGAYGVPTIVRVESDARIRIGRVLDAGAAGVMLPRLDTAEQVRAAMAHLYYPPRGDRGVATYNRACWFGLDPGALDRADEQVVGIVQIESARAVAAAEEIASIDGVDVLFVGPRDLSHDLGVPGQVTEPAFLDAIEQVRLAARKHGKACGLRDRRCGSGGEGGTGMDVRHHRLRLDPARHLRHGAVGPGSRAEPGVSRPVAARWYAGTGAHRLRGWLKRSMLPEGSRKAQSRTPYGWSVGSCSTSPPAARMRSKVASQSSVRKMTPRSRPFASSSAMTSLSAGEAFGSARGGSRTMSTSGCDGEPTVTQRIPSNPTSLRTSKPRTSR